MIDLNLIVKLTPIVATIIFGVIGACIAYLQYITNRDRLRLSLYDKRFEAFDALQNYFGVVFRKGEANGDALAYLSEARSKCRFFYGDDIFRFLDDVWNKALELRKLESKLFGPNKLPVGEERTKAAEAEAVILKWHDDQSRKLIDVFGKYLRFPS